MNRLPSGVICLDRIKYHRVLYLIAAIWNWVLAITFVVLPRISLAYFELSGMVAPPTLLWFDGFFMLVFTMGLGFYIISRSIEKNHGIIKMGIFEKTMIFIIGLGYFFIAQASIWVVTVTAGDLIFGMLFIEDFLKIKP
jgi:hypothetical protein